MSRLPVRLEDIPQHIRDRVTRAAVGLPPEECWQPIGRPQQWGYYYLHWRGQTVEGMKSRGGRVHRLAYQIMVGEIPDGCNLHHECHNRWCWNPNHLTPTPWDEHGRQHNLNGETCRKGLHPWPESMAFTGERPYCKPCRDAWMAAHPDAHKKKASAEPVARLDTASPAPWNSLALMTENGPLFVPLDNVPIAREAETATARLRPESIGSWQAAR